MFIDDTQGHLKMQLYQRQRRSEILHEKGNEAEKEKGWG